LTLCAQTGEVKTAAGAPPQGARSGIDLSAWLLPLTVLAVLATAWATLPDRFGVPEYLIPSLSSTLRAVYHDVGSGLIFGHFGVTLAETLTGFALAGAFGISLGAVIALVPAVEKAFAPYIYAFQALPKVALAPLLIIWLGYGIQSKILIAALVAFFPVLVNVIAGIRATDRRQLLLMQALGASTWQTFRMLRLPAALPYVFAGLDIAIIFALIGAVVGEFVGSSVGLGSLVLQRQAAIDTAGVISVLVFLALMGIGFQIVLRFLSRKYLFWARTDDIATSH
jgi:NitT/TauT family transport system permease protein